MCIKSSCELLCAYVAIFSYTIIKYIVLISSHKACENVMTIAMTHIGTTKIYQNLHVFTGKSNCEVKITKSS